MPSRQIPVAPQLRSPNTRPLGHHSGRARRHRTRDCLRGLDVDQGSVFTIRGMKMSWLMVVVEHRDYDAVELTYPWHAITLSLNPRRLDEYSRCATLPHGGLCTNTNDPGGPSTGSGRAGGDGHELWSSRLPPSDVTAASLAGRLAGGVRRLPAGPVRAERRDRLPLRAGGGFPLRVFCLNPAPRCGRRRARSIACERLPRWCGPP